MSAGDLTSQFIDECEEVGITKRVKIIERAKERKKYLEELISKADTASLELRRVVKVLLHLGVDTGAKGMINKPVLIDTEDSRAEALRARQAICWVLQDKGALTNSSLMELLGSTSDNSVVVYRAIKALGVLDIIERSTDAEPMLSLKSSAWLEKLSEA